MDYGTVLWVDLYPVTSQWQRESLKSNRCNKQNTVESLLTATSQQRPVFFLFRQAVHTLTRVLINLFSTATATKACPQLTKITSRQRPVFFSDWWKSQEWSWHLTRTASWWLIAAVLFWLYSIYTAAVSINSVYDTYSECSEPSPLCHAQTFWLKKIVRFFVYFISTMYCIWLDCHFGMQ